MARLLQYNSGDIYIPPVGWGATQPPLERAAHAGGGPPL